MKVFTVGLDDKEKAQKSDLEKAEPPKVPLGTPPAMPVPAPIIVPRAPPPKRWGCGVLSWIVAAFFIVLLCLTISEITYNRQRDQAFLRLKWAELRQRMLGFELLSQAQQQIQQPQPQIQQPINELPAFPRRQDSLVEDSASSTTTTTTTAPANEETPLEVNNEVSTKFDLLRMLLSKMRENAEEMGLNGDMQVHVIEVKPIQGNQMSQQAIDDAFGEVAMPRQIFGPFHNPEVNNEMGNRGDLGWQFDRDSIRPSPWIRPADRFNRWDGPQFVDDNQVFGPIWDAPEEEPQMRITHHFEKDSHTPERVVTEVFGNNPEIIGHILGEKNAQAQLQFQQQQQQQPQPDMFMPPPQPQPQPWYHPAQPWVPPPPFHQFAQPQPWAQPQPQPQPQPHFWEPRLDQPVPPQPMVLFINQPPQPQNQFHLPSPPLPPFHPSIGQQNQFPFPVQNQAPIFPQPFGFDANNNLNNNFHDNNNVNPKPWYMSGDDQNWQQTWENTPVKFDTPFNPHPAAAAPWVDNTAAVVEPHPAPVPVVPQPVVLPDPHTGHDSDGIDGFPREEKFNVPVDIAVEAHPKVIENAVLTPDHPIDSSAVNSWQHAQPEAAEEQMPASVPVVSDPNVGPAEDKDFLPLRDNEEIIPRPLEETEKAVVVQDDFPKKVDNPFFQVDDPNSVNNFRV
ncbi:hypothetical protein RB195_016845 [Necator americanus]